MINYISLSGSAVASKQERESFKIWPGKNEEREKRKMKKITRTIPTLIIRYTDKDNQHQVKPCVSLEPMVVTELVSSGATNVEVGYAPVLFSMDEDVYIANAQNLTNMNEVTLYKEKKDCPKRATR